MCSCVFVVDKCFRNALHLPPLLALHVFPVTRTHTVNVQSLAPSAKFGPHALFFLSPCLSLSLFLMSLLCVSLRGTKSAPVPRHPPLFICTTCAFVLNIILSLSLHATHTASALLSQLVTVDTFFHLFYSLDFVSTFVKDFAFTRHLKYMSALHHICSCFWREVSRTHLAVCFGQIARGHYI